MVKDIAGFEGYYEVSDTGEIRNVKSGHVLKPYPDKDGYPMVHLVKDGKVSVRRRVHRIVAEAFVPNPNNYPVVMHKDSDKNNVHASNFEYGTATDNTKQAIKDGLLNPPGVRQEYSIVDENNRNVTGLVFLGQKAVLNLMGYGSKNTVRHLLNNHRNIKHNTFKDYYIVRGEGN